MSEIATTDKQLSVPGVYVPSVYADVAARLAAYKTMLEESVRATKGRLGSKDYGLIQTAVRHERTSILADETMREFLDAMPYKDRLAFWKEAAVSSERRDQAVEKLGLDRDNLDVFDEIYAEHNQTDSGSIESS